MSPSTTIVRPAQQGIAATKDIVLVKAEKLKHIIEWNELPTWMQIDSLIQRGYRRQLNSFKACSQSLFYTHNEFVNIWSHLLPALYYTLLLLMADTSASPNDPGMSRLDHRVIQLYIIGTASCLFLSAFYHCTNAHSHRVACQALKCDYSGIILSITVTNIASAYVGLDGELDLQATYIGLSLTCAAVALHGLLGPNADGPSMATWRTVICGATIGTGVLPIVHKLLTAGALGTRKFPMVHISITLTCYLVGAIVYVARMPEKYWPGRFDIWGASHQIFHVLVAVGQAVFLFGIREKMTLRHLQ